MLGLCALLAGSCTAPPTQVLVLIDAEASIADRVAVVHAEVFNSEGDPLVDFELDLEAASRDLPARLLLVPEGGDAARRYRVVATLRDASGATVGQPQEIRGGYLENELGNVFLTIPETDCAPPTGLAANAPIPAGFRCWQGRWVESCVDVVPENSAEVSVPVACGDACSGEVCIGGAPEPELGVVCDGGLRYLDRVCRFGCTESGCLDIVPSNVPWDAVDSGLGLGPLVLHATPLGEMRVRVVEGGVLRGEIETGGTGVVRQPGTGVVDGVGFNLVDVEDTTVAVFSATSLHVEEGANVRIHSPYPVIFLVHGDVQIDGHIRMDSEDGATGGFNGIDDDGGPGAGRDGASGAPGHFSGAGGGSYGGIGGSGGSCGAVLGGEGGRAVVNEDLVPLRGGSVGGSADGRMGGEGGGALQITARGTITIAATPMVTDVEPRIRAWGMAAGQSGAGGGSGGAVLLEAAEFVFEPSVGRQIDCRGGNGGRSDAGGTTGRTDDGDGFAGGDVSDGYAGGGSGSAGRILIRTFDPNALETALTATETRDHLAPRSAPYFRIAPLRLE